MAKKDRVIQIKPVEKIRWHGKVGAQSFKKPETLQALVDSTTHRYATGLTNEDIEMLQEKGCNYNLDSVHDPLEPHEFWDSVSARFKLPDESLFLNVDKDVISFIRWKICLASRFVANSVEEFEEGKWPDARWVIYDAAKALEAKASIVETKNNAIIAASKLTQAKKSRIVNILAGVDYSGYSNSHVAVLLDGYIKDDAEAVLRLIKKDDKEVVMQDILIRGMECRVIVKDGHRYLYQNNNLGVSEESVIDYMIEPENQAFVEQIKKDIAKAS